MQSFLIDAVALEGQDGIWLWPTGDWHLGAATCHYDHLQAAHAEALRRNAYMIGMGDYAEVATKDSPGAAVHDQQLDLGEQFGMAKRLFLPFVAAERCVAILDGNHERRIAKHAATSVTELMCRALDGAGDRGLYVRASALFAVRVHCRRGGHRYVQRYSILARHGSSGARLRASKMRACRLGQAMAVADLYLMGHVHDCADESEPYRYVDPDTGRQSQRVRVFVLTGHYLRYDNSYAEDMALPPTFVGGPFVWLGARRWEISIEHGLAHA